MRIDGRVLAELASSTRFDRVQVLAEAGSTNTVVASAARAGAREGLVVVADHQSAGRGRLGRRWDAPAGTSLLVSLLLRPEGLAPDRLHLATALVALSAREAAIALAGVDIALKWPNDLLVGDSKLAGVLAEAVASTGRAEPDAVVVGVGVNVGWAPPGAASLEEAAGRPIGRADLLAGLLHAVERRYGDWDAVAAEHAGACATVGRRVSIEMVGGGARSGLATGVDTAGRLVVAWDGGEVGVVGAGDVTHLRPAGGFQPPAGGC